MRINDPNYSRPQCEEECFFCGARVGKNNAGGLFPFCRRRLCRMAATICANAKDKKEKRLLLYALHELLGENI